MTTYTAEELRKMAADSDSRVQESWERSDTDGFLSQWAGGLTAQKYRLQAEIVEKGGRYEFPALFDLDGNLVAAKLVSTQYGVAWGLLDSDDPDGRFVGWFNPSHARKDATRRANNRKKGYSVGVVLAPARADIGGSGTGLSGATSCYVYAKRIDGGFSREVEIVTTDEEREDW